jgi:hypothetical protein
MANEKIHEYLDSTTLEDLDKRPVVIDCDVQEDDASWISKQLNFRTLFEFMNDSAQKITGSFYHDGNQIHTSANVPKPMNIANTEWSNGISVTNDLSGNPSRIQVGSKGKYNLQFSAQLYRTSGGSNEQVSIWFRKNGVDIPNSNTHVNVVANSRYLVASWNFFVDCEQFDFIQIMWSVTNIAITIPSVAPDLIVPHPATPSLIVTIAKL